MRALVLLVALAGCAAPGLVNRPGGIAPAQAILYRETVTVTMTDGSLCVAQRPGRARAWSGRLTGCDAELAYAVTLPEGRPAPRRVLRPEPPAVIEIALQDGSVRVYGLGRPLEARTGTGI